MCPEPSDSNEHAPPKGFFPLDQKVDLVTVPSCHRHNGATAKDDEYARNIVALAYGNNAVGVAHALDKVKRSLVRSVGLQKVTFRNPKRVTVPEGETWGFEFERQRFDRVMRKIGYALYFHLRHAPWSRHLFVASPQLSHSDGVMEAIYPTIEQLESGRATEAYYGSNPDVFRYAMIGDTADNTLIALEFYRNFVIWLLPERGTTEAELDGG